jgi:signal recognition particle receptor subunit beta
MVGALSEVPLLTTEALMTEASVVVDETSHTPAKTTTTVAMDFGRITLDPQLVLYLFGTPGQSRFWFMWDDLARGALGAVVLADTRRLADCFPALDYFESRADLPYLLAVNRFDGQLTHSLGDVREALDLPDYVPLVHCDARDAREGRMVLRELVSHALKILPDTEP